MRRSGVLAHAVVCSMLALALAGCGSSNPKPASPASEPVPSSVTPTASASPVAPTLPAEAKGTSAAAAKAFVRHFVETLNYSETSGDTTALRTLYSRECAFCEGISDGLDRIKLHGGAIKTTGWTVLGLDMSNPSAGRPIQVVATVRVAPQTVIMKRGAKAEHFGGQTHGVRRFLLRERDGMWLITDLREA